MLGAYIDIQNILNSKYKEQDVYIKTGKVLNPEAPLDQQRYELKPRRTPYRDFIAQYRTYDRILEKYWFMQAYTK